VRRKSAQAGNRLRRQVGAGGQPFAPAGRRTRATADAGKSAQAGNRLRWRIGVRGQLRTLASRRRRATVCVGESACAGNCVRRSTGVRRQLRALDHRSSQETARTGWRMRAGNRSLLHGWMLGQPGFAPRFAEVTLPTGRFEKDSSMGNRR
jgi:hypothetical protein